uniref:Protein SGT1 homolog n=1 Tax=Cacopsylla melanoneura TaxID=428564 RepID=A0A8D8XYX6_9HEMI
MSQFYQPGSDQMPQDSSYSFDMPEQYRSELNFQSFPNQGQPNFGAGDPNLGYEHNPYLNPNVPGGMGKPQEGGDFDDEPPLLEGTAPPPPTVHNIRYNWYQTEKQVVVDALIKQAKPDSTHVNIGSDTLDITVTLEPSSQHRLQVQLSHPVDPTTSSFRILGTKIEIKLTKTTDERWSDLEKKNEAQTATAPKTPYKTDWDKISRQIEDDKKEGEAALNELFQKIYGEGSDEVRKAMNKSFLESGGTVLSTNWDEVKRSTVDIKPPEGQEFKKWDS